MALIVIKPKEGELAETLMKSVEHSGELPREGTPYTVEDLGMTLDVSAVLTEAVPEPEIHLRHTLVLAKSHRLKSLGWTRG